MRGRELISRAAGASIGAILALLVIHVAVPQRSGLIALTQVMEPFIVLAAVIAAPFALIKRSSWQIAVVLLVVLFTAGRYGPILVSLPAVAGPAGTLHVATWNIEAGPAAGDRLLAALATVEADIVGVQELQFTAADALSADPAVRARFPHRLLMPDSSIRGVGVLSRHPVVEHEQWTDPPLMRALIELPFSGPVAVFVAHPLPARIASLSGMPVSLDTARRDADIDFIRSLVDADLARGRRVLMLGDFNVTEREPAYAELTVALHDAHLDAGLGPGLTWRPPLAGGRPPFGLLRIDFVLTSDDMRAVATHVDCSLPSDHCLLSAALSQPSPEIGRSP